MVARTTSPQFIPGQRWLSETEMEQGLGIVTELQGRMVTLLFPVTGEFRRYAIHDAPLARFRLFSDEQGQHGDGWSFRVTRVSEQNGLFVYHGIHSETDAEVTVPELHLAAQVATNQPLTRILTGKVDRLDLFRLRQSAQHHLQRWQQSLAVGLIGARAELLPHQLYVASQVADRHHPRVLLADEVGLGKTIEAGLIIHRRRLTGRAERVLICVPDSLAHQWLVELLRRFNLSFSLFDQERCEQAASSGEVVFASEQLVLIPQSLLDHAFWSAELLEVTWDLLVVDEAHQIKPSESRFTTLQQLTLHIESVLLLTATPEQAGLEAHFARLQLLDPDRFADFSAFTAEQARYLALAPQAEALAAAGDDQALDELLDSYGTGRVMFRNSRRHIGGFPVRELHTSNLPAADSFQQRFDWLVSLLKQHKQQKFVLICQSPESVLTLHEHLRVQHGIHAAVFHEHLTLLERDRAAAYFASPEDGCPILLCSEIGSEGRNFQFAQHLVLFDLPLHPDLLEQRIGRLDRIGQQHTIHIHVPVVQDTPEQVLFAWYQAMDAFTQPNAIGSLLYEQFAPTVQQLCQRIGTPEFSTEQLTALTTATREQAAILRATAEAGRDRLQELNAYRPHQLHALNEALDALQQPTELEQFMLSFWERFGMDFERINDDYGWLRPTEYLRVPLAGVPDEGIAVTFSRQYALLHDDMAFLTWDHPFVQQAMELLTQDEYGCTAVAKLQNKALAAGLWFIELTFSSRVLAPRQLAVQEFYPQQCFRILMDSQGRNLTDKVAADTLERQLHFIEKKQAKLILKQLRSECQQTIQRAWHPAEQLQATAIASATTMMQEQLERELTRLRQLQQRNPYVRPSEIDAVKQRRGLLLEAFAQPLLQLDATRIIINIPE